MTSPYTFFSAFVDCGPVAQHVLSFPKNSSISPIETNFAKACCATGFAFYDGYKIDTAIYVFFLVVVEDFVLNYSIAFNNVEQVL